MQLLQGCHPSSNLGSPTQQLFPWLIELKLSYEKGKFSLMTDFPLFFNIINNINFNNMKKLIILSLALITMSCSTTINQVEKYGIVEEIKASNKKWCDYQLKVWDGNKYYTIFTNDFYNVGETIFIK